MKNLILFLAIGTPMLAQKPDSLRPRNYVANPKATRPLSPPVSMPDETGGQVAISLRAMGIPPGEGSIIRSYSVELAFNKTTCILFKSPIRSVDLGSRDIMADKANEVENVLRIKATRIGFNETNFSVMTSDGKFYSFIANYNESPSVLALNLAVGLDGLDKSSAQSSYERAPQPPVEFAGTRTTQAELVERCASVMRQRQRVRNIGKRGYGMKVSLRGLFIQDNVLYYKIALRNTSNIKYDLDFIRFFIRDKALVRQTSRQELEVSPLYVYEGPFVAVEGKQTVEKVFAFPKFTIPNGKVLQVRVGERNGGRTVAFRVNNRRIVKASPL